MISNGKFYESQFEEATIELLREAHWQYAFGDDIHRKYTDPLIEEDLRNFLAVQYKDKNLTTSEMDSIVANLRNTGGQNDYYLKSATKLFSVLLASKRPLITELADKLRLKYPLLPTISPCPTMRLEAIRSIIPISCRRYPKSV